MDALAPLAPLFVVWLALLGLAVGSFLNVVIARVPAGESIVRPRSKCPKCGYQLAWYDNIPVVSWLLLRGKCRSCRTPISARYPLVELLTAVLFLLAYQRFGWTYELVGGLTLITLLVPLTFIDAEHWILPHELTLPGIVLGILLSVPLGLEAFVASALGAAIAFFSFRLMEYLGWKIFQKEALGAGDKFLFALIGAFLTYRPLLGVIFFAALQGSVFGVARLWLTGRAGPAPAPPDAPAPEGQESEEEGPPPTMTWAFLKPGLSLGRRLFLLPYALFLQPIPDDPVDVEGEEVEWTPGATNLPFGPWLAIGALEVMLLGPWLSKVLPLQGVGFLIYGR